MSDEDIKRLVSAIRDLIEAGDAIRCYPSGAVGFDDWNDERDAAQMVIGQWVDEDGTWRVIGSDGQPREPGDAANRLGEALG